MEPIYQLLKKGQQFVWSDKCEEVFCKAKELMCSDDILVHYDPSLELVLSFDASQKGIGAVLSCILSGGIEKPVTYISRVLSETEQKYSVIIKEALAIFWAVQKLNQYLLGKKFVLRTDHKPLFLEKRKVYQLWQRASYNVGLCFWLVLIII